MSYIDMKNVTFQYEHGIDKVLKDVNLEIDKGEYVVITGKSSQGKSTLGFCFNGLIPGAVDGVYEGNVTIDGLNTVEEKVSTISEKVGIVFQNPESQIFGLSVEEDVLFALENFGIEKEEITKRIEWSLKVVRMNEYLKRSPFELSGGQKQRVIIGSVLALRPDIIVLDEPTAEIDPKGKSEILAILKELNEKHNITVILIEHDMERVIPYASRFIVLEDGKIVVNDTPYNAFQDVDNLMKKGVRVPEICKLFHSLKKSHKYDGDIPITLEDAKQKLKEVMNRD